MVALNECDKRNIMFCPVTFDQPLYNKAVDIVESTPCLKEKIICSTWWVPFIDVFSCFTSTFSYISCSDVVLFKSIECDIDFGQIEIIYNTNVEQ